MTFADPDVLLLPGAGSFGAELKPLIDNLGPTARLARYPGRFGRDFGRAASFAEVVSACADQAQGLPSPPVVLVGHSFGAYVGHATAAELTTRGTAPRALVVVGADAPRRLAVPNAAVRDWAAVAAHLEEAEPGLLSGLSAEWHEVVLDTALRDLRSLQEYLAGRPPEPSCPVFSARGEHDPLTSTEGIGEWPGATGTARRVFPGGHSDLLTTPAFASWLRELTAAT